VLRTVHTAHARARGSVRVRADTCGSVNGPLDLACLLASLLRSLAVFDGGIGLINLINRAAVCAACVGPCRRLVEVGRVHARRYNLAGGADSDRHHPHHHSHHPLVHPVRSTSPAKLANRRQQRSYIVTIIGPHRMHSLHRCGIFICNVSLCVCRSRP